MRALACKFLDLTEKHVHNLPPIQSNRPITNHGGNGGGGPGAGDLSGVLHTELDAASASTVTGSIQIDSMDVDS